MRRHVGNLLMKVGNWIYGKGCDLYLPTLTEAEQLAKMNESLSKLGLVVKPRDYIGEYESILQQNARKALDALNKEAPEKASKDLKEVLRRVSRETGGGYDN